MLRPHIVILGAGFGGVYTAKKLISKVKAGEIDITIINRTNYFLFTPLLHEVATGSLSPNSVAEPLREVFAGTGVNIVQGEVRSINPSEKIVNLHSHIIEYDYLVLATGASTNYYDISGAERFALPLKDLYDATHIRTKIIDAFEEAILIPDQAKRSARLSFAIVGGGATGVEVAGELAEFVHSMVKRYFSHTNACTHEDTSISLIHTGNELLEHFNHSLRQSALKRLADNGVRVMLGSTVTSVTKDSLHLSGNISLPTSTVIWTAGVKPNIPHFDGTVQQLVGGRLVVNEYFNLLGDDRIFALGDVAGYENTDPVSGVGNSKLLPMLAQVAEGQAKIVATNILASISGKKLKSFKYNSKGSMVSVGQWFAIGEIFSLNLAGRLTWWLWRSVYLFKFLSWRKRIRIAFEWMIEAFSPRDITKISD